MQKQTILKAVGAVLLGFNVAIPLIFNAQDLFPDWGWEYHALIGFIAFCIYIVWIIDRQQRQIKKYESDRPLLTMGKTAGVKHTIDEKTHTIKIDVNLFLKNIGARAAYQLRCRPGFAPENAPDRFKLLNEETSVNRIDPNNDLEVGQVLSATMEYKEKDGRKIVPPVRTLIHFSINYSDSPSGGKLYRDELWFTYQSDRSSLGMQSRENKDKLAPYVKQAYEQAGKV